MHRQPDHKLDSFIEQYVTSFQAWDILVYFHKNPGSDCRASDLGHALGRQTDDIDRALLELAGKEILSCREDVYTFTTDSALRHAVGKFVQALNSRDSRLRVLALLLQNS